MTRSPLHVETLGTGVPIIFLHSSGLSSRQWKRLGGRMAEEGYRSLLVDLTGQGSAPAWPEPTPFTYLEDVASVAALLKEEPAHLVGHSYGGLIALLAARQVPTQVLSMSLFDPVAFGVLSGSATVELDAIGLEWGDSPEQKEAWLRAFVDFWGGPGAWVALREDARAEFRRVGWVVKEGVMTLQKDATSAESCAVIRAPVSVITGERSPDVEQRVVARLAQGIPQATHVTIAGAGHMGPLTHGEKVGEIVMRTVAAG